jgi:hypothetical protein
VKGSFLYFLLLPILLALPPKASADALVSLEGIELERDGYVSAFSIDTWDVRILAVCHLPLGWSITAGRNVGFDGHVAGEASGFALNLNAAQLGELRDLFLIETPDFAREKSPTEPPMFSGAITLGSYRNSGNPEANDQTVSLAESNIVLRPATECPKPSR